jgi:hypothetical protein
MIGRSFPLGNLWGIGGENLRIQEGSLYQDLSDHFEEEDEKKLQSTTDLKPCPAADLPEYFPNSGWSGQPLLYSIASFADTITELKFCGFLGSPVIRRPDDFPDIQPLLFHHLQYFHKLEELILSVHLLQSIDLNRPLLIKTWREDAASDYSYNSQLDSSFRSKQLGEAFFSMLKDQLSPQALQKGIRLRASLCVGSRGSTEDIFELDVMVDSSGVRTAKGPLSIWDGNRWWTKLTERRYF